jgi:tetratricopeptide (TPR) repeat protein
MTIAFDRHHDDLSDFPSLSAFFSTLKEPFDFKSFVSARIGWWRKLCELQQRHLPNEHADVATSLNKLAELYYAQGDYAKAEPRYKRALAICEKSLGPEHPHVAACLNNLGMLYYNQDQYAKAEPLLQRALAIREKAFSSEHPDVATSLENYARCLLAMDRSQDAESLEARAMGNSV